MQSIADLTRVQRGVVSMWRARSADTPHPFPPSLSEDELLFDAQQIAAWLEATGKGNNSEAPLEVLLHSSLFEELRGDPETASVLFLLHDLVGGPLAEIRLEDVHEALAHHAPSRRSLRTVWTPCGPRTSFWPPWTSSPRRPSPVVPSSIGWWGPSAAPVRPGPGRPSPRPASRWWSRSCADCSSLRP